MRLVRRLAGQNWLVGGLLPLVVLLAEALWFFPWLVWLGKLPISGLPRTSLGPVSVIVLLGGSFLVTRFLLGRRWRPNWVRLGVIASGLAAILLVLRLEYGAGYGALSGQWFDFLARALLGVFSPGYFTYLQPVVVALAAAVYLWWRGIRWGCSAFSFEDIYRAFVAGVIALVVLAVSWALSSVYGDLGSMLASVGIWVAGFFFFGLASLALGNFQIIHEKVLGLEGAVPLFGRRWLALLFTVTGGIVLLGVGLAAVFSVDLAGVLGNWLGLAGDGLLRLLYYLFLVIGYLVAGLVYAGRYLISLLPGREPPGPVSVNATLPETGPEPEKEIARELGISPEVLLALKWVILAAVAAAVLYLLARAVARAWSSRTKNEVEEINESLWSWDAFRGDLRLFWDTLRRRFQRKYRPIIPVSPVPSVYYDEAIPDHPDMRAIYRHLLREAAGAGIARCPEETPAEYATRLGQVVPGGQGEMAYLTDLYQCVRYGEVAAPAGALAQANRLFRGLCQRLRALRKAANI
ncbi:MAG: DUF4129 domain-containing protein [Chloroflexota bacterium]